MTTETSKQQWLKLDQTINTWLKERQELIVLYCTLCGVRELTTELEEARVLKQLNNFCQILMDYLSAGHFEIFEEIFEMHQTNEAVKQTFKENYPQIESMTPKFLDFNDVYDTEAHCKDALSDLPKQLSTIGTALCDRFDLEDELIKIHKLQS